MNRPAIVFTDLDGTLLDHASYSWKPAQSALTLLRGRHIPLVLASSKTAAEIAPLRDEIGFAGCPAIVENGAGVLEPGEHGEGNAGMHEKLLAAVGELPEDLRRAFSGFSDWTTDEIVDRTGLPVDSAALAARRRFSEPGLWSGDGEQRVRFERLLAEKGITARQGGRFLTLSFGTTKADRMREIAARYGDPHTIALGDAPNDIEMLQRADTGVIVANPHGSALPELQGEAEGRIVRTQKPGPDGWNEAVRAIILKLDAQR